MSQAEDTKHADDGVHASRSPLPNDGLPASNERPPTRPVGIVIGEDEHSARVAALLREHMATRCEIITFPSVGEAAAAHAVTTSQTVETPVPEATTTYGHTAVAFMTVVVGDETASADSLLRPIATLPSFSSTRIILLCTSLEISGVQWLTDSGRLDWVGYVPELRTQAFLENIDHQLVRFRERHSRVPGNRVSSVFDQPDTDAEIIEMILGRIEEALGRQPRITVPAGTRLTIKNKWVEEVTIILRGSVALIHESPRGDIVMHEESTGRFIGLLAVSEGRRAFLTAITTSEVTGVRLTTEQLNSAIAGHPDITLLVATLFIRFLDRRLRRAEELHIENVELSEQLALERSQLATERAQLETALTNLEEARTELMAHERLASLGALAAGMAHELNNPMAAIQRISEYLGEDVSGLLREAPDSTWANYALTALNNGLEAQSLSTRAERSLRRELTKITRDEAVAQRLVLAGIRDTELAKQLRRRSGISLESAERAASIGTQLRNLRSASVRITELVSSLRSYARPDGDPVTDVDLHENLDDAIRLLSHKLDAIAVARNYHDIPRIECHPGQLAQVWTNLLTNAAEAITEAAEAAGRNTDGSDTIGTIEVRTSEPAPGWLRIEITDDGPGIPETILPRIFEPRFTTKSGQVRFGMGIGMGVARSIVGKHHGTMRIKTGTAGTTIIVELPVRTPKEEE